MILRYMTAVALGIALLSSPEPGVLAQGGPNQST